MHHLFLLVSLSLTHQSIAQTCDDHSSQSDICRGYDYDCCVATTGCAYSNTPLCQFEGGPNCCYTVPTTSPTNQPTPSPSCPDTSSQSDPCYSLTQACCTQLTACYWKQTALCRFEGGPTCCALSTNTPTQSPVCPVNAACDCYGTQQDCEGTTSSNVNGCRWHNGECWPQTDDPTTQPSPQPTTPQPTASPTCPDFSGNADPCNGYSQGCCPTDNGLCQWSSTPLCRFEGGPFCCEKVTPQPTTTEPTTPEPTTPEPTTPEPTTPEPTTPEPTTPQPTTPEPTTPQPTTPEPTTPKPTTPEPTTPQPTTPEPTTDSPTTPGPTTPQPTTPEPTTPEPTTPELTTPKPTTPSPTTPEPTTPEPTTPKPTTPEPTTPKLTTPEPTIIETPEPTLFTYPTTRTWPTKRPTMKSALKWEMIHPAYKGGDGELLWHIYYGDYSNDPRFDHFRQNEMWDAHAIKSILDSDVKFKRYRSHKKSEAVLADTNPVSTKTESGGHSGWLIILSIIFIAIFAYWYKCKGGASKLLNRYESKPLLNEQQVNWEDYQPLK